MAEKKLNVILVIEMKSKSLDRLLCQLKCTGSRLIQMKDICFPYEGFDKYLKKIFFFAVANGASSREWGRLMSHKVPLNGTKRSIIALRCGEDPIEKIKNMIR